MAALRHGPKILDFGLAKAVFHQLLWGRRRFLRAMYPTYARGLAYLALQKPTEAAAELQKISITRAWCSRIPWERWHGFTSRER